MIIIQAEDGAIITDPKEIYIDADLSGTDRVKAVKLTVFDYPKEDLEQMLETMYKKMDKWLFMNECPHYVIRMGEIQGMVSLNNAEADNG